MTDNNELVTAHVLADTLNLAVDTIWRYTREKKSLTWTWVVNNTVTASLM